MHPEFYSKHGVKIPQMVQRNGMFLFYLMFQALTVFSVKIDSVYIVRLGNARTKVSAREEACSKALSELSSLGFYKQQVCFIVRTS